MDITASVQSARTEARESVYATVRSAHPQCAVGMQTVSDSTAETLAERGHFEHLPATVTWASTVHCLKTTNRND